MDVRSPEKESSSFLGARFFLLDLKYQGEVVREVEREVVREVARGVRREVLREEKREVVKE